MPWNEADRRKYDVIRARYSSDMSDAEFAIIAELLPPPKRLERKPTDARIILNALFYMNRCGCPWHLLPKCFPPFTTVQNRFYVWRDSGLWEQIVKVLATRAREAEGRHAAPTAVVVDRHCRLIEKGRDEVEIERPDYAFAWMPARWRHTLIAFARSVR